MLEVPDENGHVVYYIVNYEQSGFVIISADNRTNPILGFSESSQFSLNTNMYPKGLVEWLASTKDYIREIREHNIEQSKLMEEAWKLCEIQLTIGQSNFDCDNQMDCENQSTKVGPLLATIWGQGTGYNELVPHTGCNNYLNGRAPTGCVATAMAQIMKYHQYPASYNWDAMPNTSGSSETSRLMRDIGTSVNMDYSCNGSGADTENEVAASFKNDFNYTSATYSDYDSEVVKQQLRGNKPVILRGGRESGWWIFVTYKDGHAWISDGYLTSLVYSEDCSMAWESLYFHMNWGWSGELNGWFTHLNWNPGDHTFNYKKGMVYNIKP